MNTSLLQIGQSYMLPGDRSLRLARRAQHWFVLVSRPGRKLADAEVLGPFSEVEATACAVVVQERSCV